MGHAIQVWIMTSTKSDGLVSQEKSSSNKTNPVSVAAVATVANERSTMSTA